METFWDRVSVSVQNQTGMSAQRYQLALEKHENLIVEFLKFNCYPDDEEFDEIVEQKKKILKIYTSDISQAISKIEVYYHDLDSQIVEAVFQLLQNISCAELTEDYEKKKLCYAQTLSYTYFMRHMVQLSLSKLYLDRIKVYKKNLKNFNHEGYYINGKSFDYIVKEKKNGIKKQYKTCRKKYLSYVNVDKNEKAFIRYTAVEEEIGLTSLLEKLESLIKLYEDNYPYVVDNGYKMSFSNRAVNFLISVISGSLVIYGFLNYIGVWEYVVSWLSNLA